jgi:drug/metabolite transporter (DMT)-like permease
MNALLTSMTLVAFAANSLLCRMALAPDLIDPVAFTAIRLGSGVAVLVPLSALISEPRAKQRSAGSWRSGAALFVYAVAFSLAYVSLETGTGALILFGSVQATMIGVGLWSGERPLPREWLGLLVAMAGLVYLVLPGIAAPDFTRTLPFAVAGLAIAWGSLHATPRGVALAVVSGSLTSGLGYVLWYLALRGLTASRAAIVQLAVPVLAAVGGIVVLAEEPTVRLGVSSVLILGGVGVAVVAHGTVAGKP